MRNDKRSIEVDSSFIAEKKAGNQENGDIMKAIDTDMGVAFLRAYGMLYPKEKRLFEDPYSEKLLTPFYKFFLFLMRSPKIFDFIMKLEKKKYSWEDGLVALPCPLYR